MANGESRSVYRRATSSSPADIRRADSFIKLAWLVLVAAAGMAVAWFRTRHLVEASALHGFEPSALIDPVWNRPEFAADFPNGEATPFKTVIGQVYRLLGLLPLSKQAIVVAMIFAEFCTLAAGTFSATRAIDRTLPVWAGLGTALLLTTGTIISCDLARWFHPNYGWVYSFAYGAGLIGFAAIMAKRPVLAGTAVGVAGTIHPIIAMFFGLATAVAALVRIKSYSFAHLAAGGLLALLITGGWAYLVLGESGVSGAEDPELYIALTRMMSSHWFPFSLGVFGVRSWETLLPFTGFMVLFASLLGSGDERRNQIDRQIGVAVLALILLALAGAVISEYSGVPLLAKLALHRASAVALVIAAAVVVPRLLAAAAWGSWPRAALSAVLLLMPFWRDHGLPILLCVLFALLIVFEERRSRGSAMLMLPISAAALAILLLAVLRLNGTMPALLSEWNVGQSLFYSGTFLLALGLSVAARLLRQPAMLVLPFAIALTNWVPVVEKLKNPEELEQARAYLQVQEWARLNTATDALFMTDPGHAYGWREHSERPSFGTLREWLYSGWIYDTREEIIREGLKRATTLGLDVDTYLAKDRREPGTGYGAMRLDASRLYHRKSGEWFGTMAATYGIDYFVFDKAHISEEVDGEVVFENARYLVVKAPK